jgi:hypothetical protein
MSQDGGKFNMASERYEDDYLAVCWHNHSPTSVRGSTCLLYLGDGGDSWCRALSQITIKTVVVLVLCVTGDTEEDKNPVPKVSCSTTLLNYQPLRPVLSPSIAPASMCSYVVSLQPN